MRLIFLTALLITTTLSFAQDKNKILTLGTFHFHLVKAQLGVDLDINSEASQTELKEIVKQIESYHPTKIFVEWEYSKQDELDTLYSLYLKDKSYGLIKQQYGEQETKYFDSEIQQLGFKLADKLGHKKLFAFDYILNEPNDTVMAAIQKANQSELMNEIQQDFGAYGQALISKFQQEKSIKICCSSSTAPNLKTG